MDASMLSTLGAAHADGWSRLEELLATNIEVTHMVFRAMAQAWSDKGTPIPEPLKIPRPHDKPTVVRPGDLFRRLFGR